MTSAAKGVRGLGARVHLFIQPAMRDEFIALFRETLACDVVEREFGLAHPVLLVRFQDGSSFSVEFTELAPLASNTPIGDANAFRGAWMEFRTDDVAGNQTALRQAGIPEFRHKGSEHSYFVAPGGQVFRLLSTSYDGP